MRKVILVTPGTALKTNLHLKLFYSVLENNDYTVYPFSLMKILKYRKEGIWHIHWIDQFHRGSLQKLGINKSYKLISIIRLYLFFLHLFFVKAFKIPIIWSIHNISSHEYGDTIFEKMVITTLFRYADRFTTFNNITKRLIKNRSISKKMFIARQGIYEGCFPRPPSKKQARKLLKLPENKFILLLFGALLPYKGVDILINSLKIINDEDIFIIIAGSIKKNLIYGKKIKKLAHADERILLIDNFIPDKKIPILFGAADYAIYPYKQINNSGVLYMALTFGTPVIISNKGGIKETIDLVPDVGIMFDEPTYDNIKNAIQKAKNKKNIRHAMERIQKQLKWVNFEQEICNVFKFNK